MAMLHNYILELVAMPHPKEWVETNFKMSTCVTDSGRTTICSTKILAVADAGGSKHTHSVHIVNFAPPECIASRRIFREHNLTD